MDAAQHPDDSATERAGDDEAGHEGPSSHPGLIYGMIAGMVLGTVLFVVTGQVLWLAVGMPLGLAVGLAFDSIRQ